MARSSSRVLKRTLPMRCLLTMGVAVTLVFAVAVASAQTQDSRIVFSGPTDTSSNLTKRIQVNLAANNYPDCPWHVCEREGRQPRRKEDWYLLGCYCDNACGMFGDCCRDADRAAETPRSDVKCMPLRQYTGVYVVSECPAEWPKDEVNQMCEVGSPENLQAQALVTNRRTGLTYRNWACALCHEDTDEAVSWPTRLECPTASKGANVTLKDLGGGQWGLSQMLNGTEVVHACFVDPFMPETVTDVVRHCQPLVDSCPESWNDPEVAELCDAYTAKAFDSEVRAAIRDADKLSFRNPHCALCNGVNAVDMICDVELGQRGLIRRDFNVQAFTILLDVTEDTGSNIVGAKTVCDDGEFWDQAFIKCRSLSCDEGFKLENNVCVAEKKSRTGKPNGKGTIVFPENGNNVKEDDNKTQEAVDFQRCPKIYLSPGEFIERPDGTVLVEQYELIFKHGEFEMRQGELAICSVASDFRKFDYALTILSLVFLAGSIFCLCCHLVLFCLVPDLRNLSGKNLASLCVCLLLGYVCFVTSPFETAGSEGCRTLGIVMYTAFIASFFWMNVMAFDVFITLRQAMTELRVTSGRHRKRYLLYLLYVCVLTAALVAAAVGTDSSADPTSAYRPAFGERVCWFSRRRALMVFFAVPLILIMVANVALFLGSTSVIRRTGRATASMSCGPTKTNLRLYSRLATITGLSWLVGLVATWLDFPPLWYAFVVLNTLQGVFIFIFFTLADRVRDRIRRDLSRYSRWQAGDGAQRLTEAAVSD
ncbi:G-protein coupled receptor Mth2 [Amphibalanus amphitrite]|uniref:G-protein coupled receptor Mth2 n=1 Tax=Amphibalanus amphitrite TaxID=1232801 RepID=A0A6A4WHP2_AMPAM|nr:G-protein coupled receptor Mth2 [Amphibalanus amphitrite]